MIGKVIAEDLKVVIDSLTSSNSLDPSRANYSKIGIAYTLLSTKEVSTKLIKKQAKDKHKSIQIKEIDCRDWVEEKNIEQYELEIANRIRSTSRDIEVVLLAQASMEGTKKHLNKEKYNVVSSTEFGVKK